MPIYIRPLTLLFSLCLHGAIGGICFLLSAERAPETALVYHVALAEFAQPGPAREPPAPEASAPAAEAVPPSPPEAEVLPQPPTEEPPVKPETVSLKKAKPQLRPRPVPPAAQPGARQDPGPATAPVAGRRQFGGLSAYDQDYVDQLPSISRRVAPDYPARAMRLAVEGTVVVELVVDAAGLPKACVIHSAGPPGYFEEAALSAAWKMRFIPGKIRGVPVNTLVRLPFVFRLR